MVIRSIRWRLQLWLGVLLTGVLAGFGVVVHQLQGVALRTQLDEELERRVAALNLAVRGGEGGGRGGRRPPPEGRGPGSARTRLERPSNEGPRTERTGRPEPRLAPGSITEDSPEGSPDIHFVVWSRDRTLIRRSPQGPEEIPCPDRPGRSTQILSRSRDGFRERYQFTEMGDCVLAGISESAIQSAQQRLAWTLLGVGVAVLSAGLGGGWWLSTRALRPVEEIRSAAMRIAEGSLSERIATTEPESEIGRLAQVLNSMFDRLESAFARQRQFTADAAHELRTPISVLLVEAQSALSRERSPAEYQETLAATLATAQQMRRLTESLLQLARLDAGAFEEGSTTFDVALIARHACDGIRSLVQDRGLQLRLSLRETPVHGHPDALAQVITNLLANAIQYNNPGGTIEVRARREFGEVVLEVADTGIGIPEEDLPRIFDRFYRGDRARSRAQGHTGLGLAICKEIVEAHHGRLIVESAPGAGSCFRVTLPTVASPPG